MLEKYRGSHAMVMGIPAGGMAVAVEIARKLHLPLDIAVVSKITLPWNSEAGYGAVAFNGTVMLNEELLSRLNLSNQEIQAGIKKTEQKVARRVAMFRGIRKVLQGQTNVGGSRDTKGATRDTGPGAGKTRRR